MSSTSPGWWMTTVALGGLLLLACVPSRPGTSPLADGVRPDSTLVSGAYPAVLFFQAEFAGVEGEELLWRGSLTGAEGGDVTIAMAQLFSRFASAEPVWPVRVRWKVRGASPGTSFVAELEGIVDWKRARMHLDGRVVGGPADGMQLTVHAPVADLDFSGTVQFGMMAASR